MIRIVYVGETERTVKERFKEHLADVRHNRPNKVTFYKYKLFIFPLEFGILNLFYNVYVHLCFHFLKDVILYSKYTFQKALAF